MRPNRLLLHGSLAALVAFFCVSCDGSSGGDGSPTGGGSPVPQPLVQSVFPASGPVAGGTILQIAGAGFEQGVTKVTIGGVDATQVVVARDSQMSCVAPPGESGAADLVITTELATVTSRNAYLYFNPLSLTRVTPPSGSEAGGTEITLEGSGFNAGLVSVTINGVPATGLTRLSDNEARCTTPSGSLGPANIVLTANSGEAAIPGGFLYGAAPTILSVSPSTGFETGGFRLELRGTGFSENGATGNTVFVGGVQAETIALSDDLLRATAPANPVGPALVQLTNSNGSASVSGGFVYYGLPMQIGSTDTQIDANALAPQDHQMAVDGNRVYVVWADGQGGVRFNWSEDGGGTFQPNDTRIDAAPAGATAARPQIAVQGSEIYVVWEDTRNGASDIYSTRSSDGGATWPAADVRVDTDTAGAAESIQPQLCAADTSVYVLWSDQRDGYTELYFNRSVDGGMTFEADRRVDTDPNDSTSSSARMCCDGPRVFVVWEDERSGDREIYFHGSLDGGASWYPTDTRLDPNNPTGSPAARPQIACDGARIYCVWNDRRLGPVDHAVYFNRSSDGGNSWMAEEVRVDDGLPNGLSAPRLAAFEQTVCVAWEDTRAMGQSDIYFNRSLDAGDTWLANDVRIDTDAAGAASSQDIALCLDGSNVFVAWADDRSAVTLPGEDIHLNHSTDSGATWLGADLRLDTDATDARAISPRVVCDGARILVSWHDFRDGFGNQLRMNRSMP